MDIEETVSALAALAQETRLQAFKILVRHEPDGVAAGELARLVGVPQNTLSTHLSILSHANLVLSERFGRSVIYKTNLKTVHGLVLHLLRDCCNGRPELCEPLVQDISACCTNEECRL